MAIQTRIWAATAAGALLFGSVAATAAGNPVETRQATMKAIGLAMRDAGKLANGPAYDPAQAKALATSVAKDAKTASTLFPVSTKDAPKSSAAPTIWTDSAGFKKQFAAFQSAATAAANASGDQASFKAAFQTLGGSCKTCHDVYRKKPA